MAARAPGAPRRSTRRMGPGPWPRLARGTRRVPHGGLRRYSIDVVRPRCRASRVLRGRRGDPDGGVRNRALSRPRNPSLRRLRRRRWAAVCERACCARRHRAVNGQRASGATRRRRLPGEGEERPAPLLRTSRCVCGRCCRGVGYRRASAAGTVAARRNALGHAPLRAHLLRPPRRRGRRRPELRPRAQRRPRAA